MESQQNAILLSIGANFFASSQNIDKSVKYTATLSECSFPKKEKELSLSFRWQIYVMMEPRILRSSGKLYIWKSELTFP